LKKSPESNNQPPGNQQHYCPKKAPQNSDHKRPTTKHYAANKKAVAAHPSQQKMKKIKIRHKCLKVHIQTRATARYHIGKAAAGSPNSVK